MSPTLNKEDELAFFRKAKELVRPGRLFRFVTSVYADRKLLVFLWIHCVCTLVVWGHFAMIKNESQAASVSEDEAHYWLKRIAPPFVYGSKHAILLNMAVIPLTMSRFSISTLSDTVVNRFVPLNKALTIHIFCGTAMVVIVLLATLSFLFFYGTLCIDGEQEYCEKLNSEIMWTGYAIASFVLLLGVTSHYRHKIPYELFYAVHHLAFVLYVITVAHTFDIKQRNHSRQRSQTFSWVSATLLFYLCDRAAMYLNHRYHTRLISSSAVTGCTGTKMVILKMRRPVLFNFKPGQYAFIRMTQLDQRWHPFSIASGPDASCLEFYIEVFEETSWTWHLWQKIKRRLDKRVGSTLTQIDIELMGPYGTSIANTDQYSHALAFGTGTGIVPVLSLFKQHVRQLTSLEPGMRVACLQRQQRKIVQVERALEHRKTSLVKKIAASTCLHVSRDDRHSNRRRVSRKDQLAESIRSRVAFHDILQEDSSNDDMRLRDNLRAMQSSALHATRSIYGVVLLTVMPIFGVSLIALTISWNTITIELYDGMVQVLMALTVVFQLCFAAVAFFVWDASQFAAFIDTAICLVVPFANWYWFRIYKRDGMLNAVDVVTFCLVAGYMTARVWSMTVKPRHRSWTNNGSSRNASTLERLEVVWTSRSASLVSEILPGINQTWEHLVYLWGEERAWDACRISIYVTDKDEVAVRSLQCQLRNMSLSNCVFFERASLGDIIEQHTLDLVASRRNSNTVLAFCGSSSVASHLHQLKINNDMVAAITGNKRHQMEFVSENYGGVRQASTKGSIVVDLSHQTESMSDDEDDEQPWQEHSPDGTRIQSLGFDTNFSDYAAN